MMELHHILAYGGLLFVIFGSFIVWKETEK